MSGKEGGSNAWFHWTLFLGLVAFPVLLSLVTADVSFERSKSFEFCSSCHAMTPYAQGLRDPDSDLLAAKHYQYRRINYNQCYTCHTDYSFMGPMTAKLRGMQHLLAYYGGSKRPPKLYKPFPNANCLQCHDGAKSFMRAGAHLPIMDQLRSGDLSCIDCHGPVHPHPEGKQ